jgi:hypothetical protein
MVYGCGLDLAPLRRMDSPPTAVQALVDYRAYRSPAVYRRRKRATILFVYDLDLMRPGSPIIQAMQGANVEACKRFPEPLWLSRPTFSLTLCTIKEIELDELVRLTLEHNGRA